MSNLLSNKYDSKPYYKIIINIFACATIQKYIQEIRKINETWGKKAEENGIKILFFLGTEPTQFTDTSKYIHLEHVSNDYQSASHKQNLGLKFIYENYTADFIYTCGTDTYIHIDNLLSYIKQFDKNKTLYIGGHGDYRQIGDENVYYHSGGGGFILSYKVLEYLYPRLHTIQYEWETLCIKNNIAYLCTACDLLIGYYVRTINTIEIIKSPKFYGCNYKGYANNNTFLCCGNKINPHELISCHCMSIYNFDEYTLLINK